MILNSGYSLDLIVQKNYFAYIASDKSNSFYLKTEICQVILFLQPFRNGKSTTK